MKLWPPAAAGIESQCEIYAFPFLATAHKRGELKLLRPSLEYAFCHCNGFIIFDSQDAKSRSKTDDGLSENRTIRSPFEKIKVVTSPLRTERFPFHFQLM